MDSHGKILKPRMFANSKVSNGGPIQPFTTASRTRALARSTMTETGSPLVTNGLTEGFVQNRVFEFTGSASNLVSKESNQFANCYSLVHYCARVKRQWRFISQSRRSSRCQEPLPASFAAQALVCAASSRRICGSRAAVQ